MSAVATTQLEHELARRRQAEDELRTIMDMAPVAIWVAPDPACSHITGNPMANRFFEAAPGEDVSASDTLPVRRFFHDGRELQPAELPMQKAAAHGMDVSAELEVLLPSGKRIYMLGQASPLRDLDGRVRGAVGAFIDITKRKQVEAQAEQARQTLHALLEHIPEGIAIAGVDGASHTVSRFGAETVTGRSGGSLEHLENYAAHWSLLYPDGLTPVQSEDQPLTRAIRDGETVIDEEFLLQRPDNSTVPVLCNAGPIRDREGKIAGGVLAWRDISVRKEWERRLHEIQKRESIAVLAGGIAHDFNNLLTTIIGNADLLTESILPDDPDQPFLDAIVHAAERAAALTRQMLAYSGKGRFQIRPVDLSNAVCGMMPLLRPAVPASIRIDLELAPQLPPVNADPTQIDQIILNLVTNAAEAFAPDRTGAAITITTGLQESSGASYVFLQVRDNGPGIPPDALATIFEPFYTTKFSGRGLGLAAVDGIVRSHGGSIEVDTAPERGAAFRILLPAAGPSTVLVVDDDQVICDIVRTTLKRHGYSVLTAHDGRQAVDSFRRSKAAVVLLDMVMPGMSGEQTLRELQRIDADVPVIISTGYSDAEARRRFLGDAIAGFLFKPFTPAALLQKVRTAGRRPGAR